MDSENEVNSIEREFMELDKNGAWAVAYQVCLLLSILVVGYAALANVVLYLELLQ